MAKKEKMVDLKPKAEKITDDQLKMLQSSVSIINQTQMEIGRLETQKHKLLHDIALGNDTVSLLQDKMMKEYGSYDINLTDGTINWPKDEK